MRVTKDRCAAAVGALLLVAACSSGSTGSSDPSSGGVDPTRTPPTPSQTPDPAPSAGEVVLGWPGSRRNEAGSYSWDGLDCASGHCSMGWMHNGYGSGNLEFRITVVEPESVVTRGTTSVTVAGHDATYRRVHDELEEWVAVINGTTIAIRLDAKSGTPSTELSEAHAIIASMRAEPGEIGTHGFRLVFTLATDDWDSG